MKSLKPWGSEKKKDDWICAQYVFFCPKQIKILLCYQVTSVSCYNQEPYLQRQTPLAYAETL